MIFTGAIGFRGAPYGVSELSFVLYEVSCVGNETTLVDCDASENRSCLLYEEAAVSCVPTSKS